MARISSLSIMTGGLVAATLVSATLVLSSLNVATPQAQPLVELSASQDDLARLILERSQDPASLNKAEALVRSALDQSPFNNTARMRLIYIKTKRDKRVSAETERLLGQSYDLAPYDVTVARWRTAFALNHWASLTPDTKAAVSAEVSGFATVSSQAFDVRATLKTVGDPVGRVVATLWLIKYYGQAS